MYSFTGASISPQVKTIHVAFFDNQSPNVNPRLSQQFTQTLRNKFITETNLIQTNSANDADLYFSGYISQYQVVSTASQGGETAARNRLNISVSVSFANAKDEKQNFNQSFSRFAEFDAAKSFESVEQALVDEINRQLTEDIFNRALANW